MELEEEREKNSFKSILKGTSIFGGVQVFNILVSAIRLKFVALILGASGIGVAGLFNSLLLTIQQFASLGVNLAVVKEIGAANADRDSLLHVVAAVRPLAVLLSLAGLWCACCCRVCCQSSHSAICDMQAECGC